MYELQTTFWSDFSIADMFGLNAIRDTYKRAFAEWKNDYKYLTELVMVTNWKLWEHYENGRNDYAELYDELYRDCYAYGMDNLKGDELHYFIWTLD